MDNGGERNTIGEMMAMQSEATKFCHLGFKLKKIRILERRSVVDLETDRESTMTIQGEAVNGIVKEKKEIERVVDFKKAYAKRKRKQKT